MAMKWSHGIGSSKGLEKPVGWYRIIKIDLVVDKRTVSDPADSEVAGLD